MKEHWEKVFASRKPTEFSWFQAYPAISMDLLGGLGLTEGAGLVDVGGGDSRLADALLEKGYRDITVLDISSLALERARARLGDKGRRVKWVVSDILDFNPGTVFDCWHDRAAFHFLTQPVQVEQYINIASHAIKKGGYLVVGTFSKKGPNRCSGLEIQQYDEDSLVRVFGRSFEKLYCREAVHLTPSGSRQDFIYCVFRRI